MRAGLACVGYATRHTDIAAEFKHEVLLKILSFPDSAALPAFNQLAVSNLPLTVSLSDYDHLPQLREFKVTDFVQTWYEGIVHWMNDSSVKFPERIFHTVN
jgi:hypothetical protein